LHILDISILGGLVLVALYTVMTSSLLRAGIGLALTSAVLTVIMYRFNAPLAAIFELSVCAGLIPVIFITVISLTKPLKKEEAIEEGRNKMTRFWPLPAVVAIVFAILLTANIKLNIALPSVEMEADARQIIWNVRRLDLIGQILILLTGAFGILILFKEAKKK